MRILWLSPWLRPLARVHTEQLRALGVDVMLVTAPLNPESDSVREYEVELLGRPVPTAGWLPFVTAYREAKRFEPDVVVTELLRDPRWRAFARLAPRVRFVHDAAPHDPTQRAPWWNRMFFDRWDARAYATVVFSNYVAEAICAAGVPKTSVYLAPLTSDLEPRRAPEFVPAEARRDFILLGRQHPYKNHDVVFAAWESHIRGTAWRGDELVLLGNGHVSPPLPRHARWVQGSYRYSQTIAELSAAKASIAHYRAASQSGVQVLSMQLGVPTLVSTAGALPEYQPPGLSVTGIDDVEGLTAAMDVLADPANVGAQAKIAVEHYQANYRADVVAASLLEIFGDVVKRVSGTTDVGQRR